MKRFPSWPRMPRQIFTQLRRTVPGSRMSMDENADHKTEASAMEELINQSRENSEEVKDPVCGMTVDSTKAMASVEHADQTYHFCGKGCAEKFRSDPEAYLRKAEKPSRTPAISAIAAGYTYQCIRKSVVSDFGSCPKCGMALEPAFIAPRCAPSTPVRCTRRSRSRSSAHAPSAAWLWSRAQLQRRSEIMSMTTCAGDSGSALH